MTIRVLGIDVSFDTFHVARLYTSSSAQRREWGLRVGASRGFPVLGGSLLPSGAHFDAAD